LLSDGKVTTRLGRDAAARRVLYDLRSARVDVDLVERDASAETPVVLYHVEPPAHWFTFTCAMCQRRLPATDRSRSTTSSGEC
jgi:sugar/nucleoside kinase (ribokinase family)